MSQNNSTNVPLLRQNLKKMIRKTSKNDVIFELDRIYTSTKTSIVNVNLIKEPSYLSSTPLDKKSSIYTIENVKKNHDISPILVRKIGSNYEVVVGRRRLYAYRILKFENISCFICDVSDEDACFMTLTNSLDKQLKNVIEIGTLLKYLNVKFKYSLTDLSKITNLSISQISNMIRVLKLPDYIQKQISDDTLSYSQAKALCNLEPVFLKEVDDRIIAEKLSVKDVEKLCKSFKKPNKYTKMESSIKELYLAKDVSIKKTSFEIKFPKRADLLKFLQKIKK